MNSVESFVEHSCFIYKAMVRGRDNILSLTHLPYRHEAADSDPLWALLDLIEEKVEPSPDFKAGFWRKVNLLKQRRRAQRRGK